MNGSRIRRGVVRRTVLSVAVIGLVLGTSSTLAPSSAAPQRIVIAGELPAAFAKAIPSSIDDLQVIEDHVSRLVSQVKHATVGIRVGRAFGSGVIISPDGYVLTAGHVSGQPNRVAEVTLFDGRRVEAVTLGQNKTADSGLLKLKFVPDDLPFADMAPSDEVTRNAWCAALGHPGGVQPGRDAVLRLGRVLQVGEQLVRTDCELVGGDSGGPLFDMRGRVIGINSRIAERADMNFHVPVSIYLDEWDRLAAGESYSDRSNAYLGVKGETGPDGFGLLVTEVIESGSADRAGLREGDLIVRFEGERVNSFNDLKELVGLEQPGARITIRLLREGRPVTIKPKLGER